MGTGFWLCGDSGAVEKGGWDKYFSSFFPFCICREAMIVRGLLLAVRLHQYLGVGRSFDDALETPMWGRMFWGCLSSLAGSEAFLAWLHQGWECLSSVYWLVYLSNKINKSFNNKKEGSGLGICFPHQSAWVLVPVLAPTCSFLLMPILGSTVISSSDWNLATCWGDLDCLHACIPVLTCHIHLHTCVNMSHTYPWGHWWVEQAEGNFLFIYSLSLLLK